jgi:hypothetical protein
VGKRDVTIYTCDGCKASGTVGRNEKPVGFSRIILTRGDVWLCSICYGAVEWITRFQGITIPPRIYGTGADASLRPKGGEGDPER